MNTFINGMDSLLHHYQFIVIEIVRWCNKYANDSLKWCTSDIHVYYLLVVLFLTYWLPVNINWVHLVFDIFRKCILDIEKVNSAINLPMNHKISQYN